MNTLADVRLIRLKSFDDPNGSLVPIEARKDIPFGVERIFYVHGVPAGDLRGEHAHKRCKQLLISLRGTIEVDCEADGEHKKVLLTEPSQALYIPEGIWAVEKYVTEGALLLVLADRPYEADDYIRDHAEFVSWRNRK